MATLQDSRERLERVVGEAQYRALIAVLRRAVRLTQRRVQLRSASVPYLYREGVGEPIVMIHGFGGDKEAWLAFATRLPRKRPLVILDLPGFGAADPVEPSKATARAQAANIRDLLDHVGARRAHLVGNSMGGGIALRTAYDHPERVASLTLVCSVGPLVEKSDLALALDRGENPLIPRTVAEFEALADLVMEKKLPTTRAIRAYVASRRLHLADTHAQLFDIWLNPPDGEGLPDVAELARMITPTLVVHGERDRVIHPATARALAQAIPGARLELLRGIGHVPQMEDPRLLAQLLVPFVDRAGPT